MPNAVVERIWLNGAARIIVRTAIEEVVIV